MLYRDFATQEAIDNAYDPMRGRDPATLLGDWRDRSDAVRRRLDVSLDVAYGPTLAECFDFYPASSPAPGESPPLHLFFHGGYWRSLGHREFGFIAEGLVQAGFSFMVVCFCLSSYVSICGDWSSLVYWVATDMG